MRWRSVCNELLVALMCTTAAGCRTTSGPGATLQVTTVPEDADADVFVDGNYIGRVADLQQRGSPALQLAPGTHRVEVRKAGRFPVQRTLRIAAGGPGTVTLAAELLEDPQ